MIEVAIRKPCSKPKPEPLRDGTILCLDCKKRAAPNVVIDHVPVERWIPLEELSRLLMGVTLAEQKAEEQKPVRWCMVIDFGPRKDLAIDTRDRINRATGYYGTVEELST